MEPTWGPGAAAGACVQGLSLKVQTEGPGPGGGHGRYRSHCKAAQGSPCRAGCLPEEGAEAGPAGQVQGGPSGGSPEDLTAEGVWAEFKVGLCSGQRARRRPATWCGAGPE